MAGRRRGARSGRGWDAAPPRARRAPRHPIAGSAEPGDDASGPDPGWAEASEARFGAGEPVRDPAERARQLCLDQLAVRPRTRAELAATLRRGGIPDDVAAEVLERYGEVGMIDDAAFARAWVSSRHHGRGLARRALASELRRRGVAAETVGEALRELDGDTEAATARALVERKLRTATGPPDTVFRRLVGMLARKGYPPGIAIRAVKEAMSTQDPSGLVESIDPDALADAVDETDIDVHRIDL